MPSDAAVIHSAAFNNVFKVNNARPATSAFRGPGARKKTFSIKRENEAERCLDDYLKRRYDQLVE